MPYLVNIMNILNDINNHFVENELAFLALTSKIENPLRDKIAFCFQQVIGDNKLICREDTRQDLTIFDRNALQQNNQNVFPECIIEFKAHSSFLDLQEYQEKMYIDLLKSAFNSDDNTEIFFILFVYLFDNLPLNDAINLKSVKYINTIIKHCKSINGLNFDKAYNAFKDGWLNNNEVINQFSHIIHNEGIIRNDEKFNDISVQIGYSIIGPLKKDQITNITNNLSDNIVNPKRQEIFNTIRNKKICKQKK